MKREVGVLSPNPGWRRMFAVWSPPAVVFLLVLGSWQAACELLKIPSYLLPTPGEIVKAGWLNRVELWGAIGRTFAAAVFGYLSSVVVGVALALIMSQSKILERSLYPYAVILQTIPIVAIAPLIVIWVGAGTSAIVVIAFLIALFPMISNANFGFISTEPGLVTLMRLYGASRWQTTWKLRFPHALPDIFTGMRISAGLAVIGAIVGEFIAGIGGGRGGLGYVIIEAANQMQVPLLFAAALASSVLGIVIFLIVGWAGRRIIGHWHASAVVPDRS